MSIREYSAAYEEPRTTVQYRRTRALKRLRSLMERDRDFSPDLVV